MGRMCGNRARFPSAAAGGTAVLLLLGAVLSFLSPCVAHAQGTPKKNVLVLNSYHRGLSWTDGIMAGVESVLKKDGNDVELFFEFMDTKRFFGRSDSKRLFEFFREKYARHHFEAIITSDNDAFEFMLRYRDGLFKKTPVIFCGVNDHKDTMLRGHEHFTGVVEETDIRSTVEIALKVHPSAKQVVLVADRTTTGIAIAHEALDVARQFKEKVSFVFLQDLTMTDLKERISRVPAQDVILLTVFNYDKTGRFFSYEESLALIAQRAKAPIYGLWDFYLGGGIVGGMLTSAFQQGKAAGEMALRVLQGADTSGIPVLKKSPNRYMFDDRQLRKFRIDRSELPTGSLVVNEPDTFYARYSKLIWGTCAAIFSLSAVVFVLLVNMSMRKRAERALRESEKKYRDLYDSAPDMYHSINKDGIIIDCNETEARMLGYAKEEMIGRPIVDFISEESRKTYERDFAVAKSAALTRDLEARFFDLEREFARRDGTTFLVSQNVSVEFDDSGELVRTKTIGRDVTEQKRMEEVLRRSQEQLRKLTAHLEAVREEERTHIAREIHDELGLVLTTLKLDLSWLRNRLSKDNEPLAAKTQAMSKRIDETIQTVQRISTELRPGVLDHLGLSSAIEWQAGEFREKTGIDCEVTIDEDIALEQTRATAVFRIFQETLTNIIRHSEATKVRVNLRERSDALVLEVGDNGKGISEEQISNPLSLGIIGIQERARFLGGGVQISGSPGRGTTVVVNVPIEER